MAEGEELRTDVLVVGAGPSGLMLAVCLAKQGVDAIVVDGKDGPTRESRALAVQARSMELYDQLGLVERVLAERAPAIAVVPGAGRRPFSRLEFRGLGEAVSPYTEITIFEQSRNERLLADALDDLGRGVRWGHALSSIHVHDAVVDQGEDLGLRHAGYHALDSLRIEKGFVHVGHDVGPTDDPGDPGEPGDRGDPRGSDDPRQGAPQAGRIEPGSRLRRRRRGRSRPAGQRVLGIASGGLGR